MQIGPPSLTNYPSILRWLRQFWQAHPNRHDALMLWAAAYMWFFGFLWAGKVVVPSASEYNSSVHLSQGDIRVDNTSSPQYLEVKIKASKMDPFWKGVSVKFGKGMRRPMPSDGYLDYGTERFRSWPQMEMFSPGSGL